MFKKHILLIALLLSSFSYCQIFPSKEIILNLENFEKDKTIFGGYYLGANVYSFKMDYWEDNQDIEILPSVGINVGVVLFDFKLNDYFRFRVEPGVNFAEQKLYYKEEIFERDIERIRDIKSTYINLPFLIKYSAKRYSNVRPFMIFGVSTTLNLAGNQNNTKDNSLGVFRIKNNVFYYDLGLGFDFYLLNFKLSPSIRGVFSLQNEIVYDEDPNSLWTSNIRSMSARGVFFQLTVQ